MPSTYAMAKSYAAASLQIVMALVVASSAQTTIRTTEFTLYIHVYTSGPNTSVVLVAGVENPPASGKFGTVAIADNLVTEGTSALSPEVGHVQNIAAVASLDNLNVETLSSMQFTSGEYNGSTVELKGLNLPIPVRELAIVGGTKQFRYATGYATCEILNDDEDYHLIEFHLQIKQDLRLLEENGKIALYSKYVSL